MIKYSSKQLTNINFINKACSLQALFIALKLILEKEIAVIEIAAL